MKLPVRVRWLLRRRKLLRKAAKLQIHPSAVSDESCQFGYDVRLDSGVRFHNATLGDYSYIAHGSRVGNADIGKFVSVGPDVIVGGLGKHPTDFFSTHPFFYSGMWRLGHGLHGGAEFAEQARTKIGNDVWIGARAVVLDGVTIADGAIVAANAVVASDVEPYAIVGGVPARVIRFRKLLPSAFGAPPDWWNLPEAQLKDLSNRIIGGLCRASKDADSS